MAHFVCPSGHVEHGSTVYATKTHLEFYCYRCGIQIGEQERVDRGDIGIRSGPGDNQDRLLLVDSGKSAHPSSSGEGDSGGTGPIGDVATHLANVPGEVAE